MLQVKPYPTLKKAGAFRNTASSKGPQVTASRHNSLTQSGAESLYDGVETSKIDLHHLTSTNTLSLFMRLTSFLGCMIAVNSDNGSHFTGGILPRSYGKGEYTISLPPYLVRPLWA